MADDHTQARLQRIEDHLRSLDDRVSVLSAVDSGAAKARIAETFGSDPRTVVIYRGVQAGLTQQQIANALKERGLPQAQQQRVSDTLDDLVELGFIERTRKGRFVVARGWDGFGLDRVLKKTLRTSKIVDLS
jgi:hypothetical protein